MLLEVKTFLLAFLLDYASYITKTCYFVVVNFSLSQVVCNNFSFLLSSFYIMFQFSSATFCGVGLKDGRVRGEDIAVSQTTSSRYQKQFARLDRQGTNTERGGWLGCWDPCGKRFSIFITVSFVHKKIKVQIQFSLNRIFQYININLNRTWIEPSHFYIFNRKSLNR